MKKSGKEFKSLRSSMSTQAMVCLLTKDLYTSQALEAVNILMTIHSNCSIFFFYAGMPDEECYKKMKELIYTLPHPRIVVMRYLFAFLNHLSQYSDENLMYAYNLAVCFGPALLPIPDNKDQVNLEVITK